ncbi:hypothetical protein HOLleu_30216 [Holothuria leucospilota]|uniref:Uncharacterized protein n=1 Tax=Holothuria leucospilota TaxID=206669 RepID=A0A9Q1BK08_HOLLE|nr:hypothetical protein HOLleu_30216 [Holothuria leucospilota]
MQSLLWYTFLPSMHCMSKFPNSSIEWFPSSSKLLKSVKLGQGYACPVIFAQGRWYRTIKDLSWEFL